MARFSKSAFVKGVKLADGVYTVNSAEFTEFDYNGKAENGPDVLLMLQLENDAGEDKQTSYKVGKAHDPEGNPIFSVEGDGRFVDGPAISENCSFAKFMASLEDAGMDMSVFESKETDEDGLPYDDISKLEGITIEIANKHDQFTDRNTGEVKSYSTPLVKSIIEEDAKSTKGKPKSTAKAEAVEAEVVDDGDIDIKDATARLIVEALRENGGEVSVMKLPKLVFEHGKEDYSTDEIEQIAELSQDIDFLDEDGHPWDREKRKIKLEAVTA